MTRPAQPEIISRPLSHTLHDWVLDHASVPALAAVNTLAQTWRRQREMLDDDVANTRTRESWVGMYASNMLMPLVVWNDHFRLMTYFQWKIGPDSWHHEGDLWSKSDIFATFWNCTKASHLRCKMASPKPFALTKRHVKHLTWSMTMMWWVCVTCGTVCVCMHVYACVHSSMFARVGTVRWVSTYPLKNMHVCMYVYTHS